MSEQLVITALGDDRPGIVDELSKALFKHNLNIEDSRMSVLGGEFAVLLLVSGPQQSIDDFVGDTASLEQTLKMKILVKMTSSKTSPRVSLYRMGQRESTTTSLAHTFFGSKTGGRRASSRRSAAA